MIPHDEPTNRKRMALLCLELAQLQFTNWFCNNFFPSLLDFRVRVVRMERDVEENIFDVLIASVFRMLFTSMENLKYLPR